MCIHIHTHIRINLYIKNSYIRKRSKENPIFSELYHHQIHMKTHRMIATRLGMKNAGRRYIFMITMHAKFFLSLAFKII